MFIEQPSSTYVGDIVGEGGLYIPRLDSDGKTTWEYDFTVESSDRLAGLLDGV